MSSEQASVSRRDADDKSVSAPQDAIETMYPRLPPDIARVLASFFCRPGATAAGDYPLSAHPDLPTALVYTTEDEFFTPEWERFVGGELLDVEPIELPGGHFPMVEAPAVFADLLDRLAETVVGQ